MHQAMQVYIFNRKSTLSIMCLPYQGVDYRLCLVLMRLDSGPVRFFRRSPSLFGHALTCHVLNCFIGKPYSVDYMEVVPMSVPASVGRPVSVCSMPTILSESIHLRGLHANSHWATLSTTRHRAIHRHTEIKVSRKYASRSKGK